MPVVKKYARGQVQGSSTLGAPKLSTNVVADAFDTGGKATAELAQGMSGATKALSEYALKFNERRDKQTTTDALNTLTRQGLEYQTEYQKNRQGKDADGLFADTQTHYSEMLDTYLADNPDISEEAKRRITEQWNTQTTSALGRAASWQSTEFRKVEIATGNASIETAIDTAVLNPNDAVALADARTNIVGTVSGLYGHLGKDVVDAEERKALGKLYGSVFTQKLDVSAKDARAFLEAHEQDLPAAIRLKAEKSLSVLELEEEAYEKADALNMFSLEKQLEEAAKIDDAELRKKVETRIRYNETLKTQVEKDRLDNAMRSELTKVLNGGEVGKAFQMAYPDKAVSLMTLRKQVVEGAFTATPYSTWSEVIRDEVNGKPWDATKYLEAGMSGKMGANDALAGAMGVLKMQRTEATNKAKAEQQVIKKAAEKSQEKMEAGKKTMFTEALKRGVERIEQALDGEDQTTIDRAVIMLRNKAVRGEWSDVEIDAEVERLTKDDSWWGNDAVDRVEQEYPAFARESELNTTYGEGNVKAALKYLIDNKKATTFEAVEALLKAASKRK